MLFLRRVGRCLVRPIIKVHLYCIFKFVTIDLYLFNETFETEMKGKIEDINILIIYMMATSEDF